MVKIVDKLDRMFCRYELEIINGSFYYDYSEKQSHLVVISHFRRD